MSTIALDAGHGGDDPGVVSACGLKEADLVLRLAQLVESMGMWVMRDQHMTQLRATETFNPSLNQRNQSAVAHGADLVISIHANASKHHDQQGGLGLYWPGNELGRHVADQIHRALPLAPVTRTAVPATSRSYPDAYSVIRSYKATSVLIEVGYLDRELDAALLSRPDVLTATALAILQGVCIWRDIQIPW